MADIREPALRHLTVGVALDGVGWHPSSWRDDDARADTVFTASYWRDLVDTAERAGIDYVTIDDSLALPGAHLQRDEGQAPPRPDPGIVGGRLDAALIASWLAPRTERIGLIPTVTTTHTEPFHLATGLQTLDHVSLGRAGWQLRISAGATEAAAFGRKATPGVRLENIAAGIPDPALHKLLDEAADSAVVARRLWDSWEGDAIIRDASTGRYLDRDRLHYIEFEGEHFSVIGPSIVPRSPQGQIPITVLAHSTPIFRLAAGVADVVFITPHPAPATLSVAWASTAEEIISEIRSIEQEFDRASQGLQPLRIVADLVVAFDSDEETAVDRVARLDELGTARLSDAHLAAGSSEQVADLIEEWREYGIEGVRLRPLSNAKDLPAIADRLLPELRRREIVSAAIDHPVTLRQRLGLQAAGNRYSQDTQNVGTTIDTQAAAVSKENAA